MGFVFKSMSCILYDLSDNFLQVKQKFETGFLYHSGKSWKIGKK